MMGNQTSVIEFILLGLMNDTELQAVLFLFLLLTYVLSILGNLTIIILTLLDYRLQTVCISFSGIFLFWKYLLLLSLFPKC